MSLPFQTLRGFAELSGSFAVSGLVAAQCKPFRTAHAFYVDPALVVFKDVTYPVIRASGTVIEPAGSKVYPVDALLRSPWSCFYPQAMGVNFLKNAALQGAFYLKSYIEHIDRLEERAREQAVLEGRDEDDIEIPLPPVPLEDLERLAKVAARSTVRECTVTQTRRRLEHGLHGQVSDQLLWKLVKDTTKSAVLKANRHNRFWQVMLRTFCTVQRAYVLSQVAEWIVSTTLDTAWLLGVPLLPPKWQVQLGVERPERPPAQIARLEQALPEVLPAVAPGGQPPPVQQQGPDYAGDDQELQQHGQGASAQPGTGQEQEPGFQEAMEEELPALEPIAWGRRSGRVAKKAVGNALRCMASLLAWSAGAAIAAGIHPWAPLMLVSANAADIATSIFITGPELSDWYEHGKLPLHTVAIAAVSLGVAIQLVDKVGKR